MTIVIAASGSELIERLRRLEALPLGLRLDGVLAAQLSPLPGGYQPLF